MLIMIMREGSMEICRVKLELHISVGSVRCCSAI